MSAAAPGAPALELEALVKRYRARTVLDGLSLRVAPGEFFGLVGVNGAGKTTCIKALLDLRPVDSGTIRVFGVAHRETRARASVSYLPEQFLPPYYLTGGDFLAYTARLERRPHDPARARRMCEALDLDPEALRRPVREYSKGMGQKLGLVACLCGERPLLVLDEPMSGLDPKARLLVKRHLEGLRAAGTTLFFSTHLLADVEEICDRMGVLHGGRLRFAGTPAECRERYRAATLEAAYLECISAG